jgi:hypothetical protein
LSIFKEYYRNDGKNEAGLPGVKAILKLVLGYFDLLFCTFSKTAPPGKKHLKGIWHIQVLAI